MQFNKLTIDIACVLGLAIVPALSQAKDQCDYIYGVHDGGLNNSQLLRYNGQGSIKLLGQPLEKHDIEALDISPNGVLFGASGDNTGKPGYLYTFDMANGNILSENRIKGCNELDGISFNPSDGILWGWDQYQGLVKIIDNACSTVVPNENGFEVEDLSWDNPGGNLYFAYNEHNGADLDRGKDTKATTYHIGKYSLTDGVEWQICDIGYPEIEALEVLNDNTLLVGYHDHGHQWTTRVDLQTCETISSGGETTYTHNDIEGLAVCLYRNKREGFLEGTFVMSRSNCSGEQKITQDNLYVTFDDNIATTRVNGTLITKGVYPYEDYSIGSDYWGNHIGEVYFGYWSWYVEVEVGEGVFFWADAVEGPFYGRRYSDLDWLRKEGAITVNRNNVRFRGHGDKCNWKITYLGQKRWK